MIEVHIDSVRISLMTQSRVVVLREVDSQRYLPIWIGAPEADAITLRLQGIQVDRPLTHDLLFNTIRTLGAVVEYVVVTELRNDIFYAEIVLEWNEEEVRIDSRPSDALALAVRAEAPIYVEEEVMEEAGRVPEEGVAPNVIIDSSSSLEQAEEDEEEDDLGAFADFIEGLDLDDLGAD
ncbi:MAG TPA: bifunctional nuclease family protein [Anaerolineae bacterium]|nr:bifunctional nuclease family protein [Caldilineae bacterium]HID33376.1 bifunctional nuclease family protein [Anaerolineae bacterium]HIQ11580.1 bifunctional nuclease family protein [Caldilineales bacterium]